MHFSGLMSLREHAAITRESIYNGHKSSEFWIAGMSGNKKILIHLPEV
jgi:hypothetical protein